MLMSNHSHDCIRGDDYNQTNDKTHDGVSAIMFTRMAITAVHFVNVRNNVTSVIEQCSAETKTTEKL